MRYLILAVLVMFSSSVFAGDESHTIRIIQEDGSVDVIDLRQSAPAPEPAPEPAIEAPASAPKAKVSAAPVKTKKAPVKKAARKKVAAVPPPAPKIVTPPPTPVQRKAAQEGGRASEIRRAQAIAVALDYAPPSSDVEVYRSEYKGTPTFSVMFKIEGGYHEVLVDALSGKVLESRKSDVMRAQPKPGHLPGSLQ